MSRAANPNLAIAPVLAGAPLQQARVVGVMVHGRDQDERVMLDVVDRLALPDAGYVLPLAAGGSWYTGRYFDPVAQLEPHLSWGIDAIEAAVVMANRAGVPHRRIVLCGFSQGACMVAELLARRPRPFAAGAVLTGTLLGPPGQRATPRPVSELPMYFASSRYDDWIPLEDVRAAARAFESAGANVVLEILDDREHLISDRAVEGLRKLFARD